MDWKLIPSAFFPKKGHMEWDQHFFENFKKGDAPILRFFHFKEPRFTLGRLESKQIHLSQLPYPYEIRPTGGRAVLHGKDDLCYSVVASTKDPLVGGDLLASYRKISKILKKAFKMLGREVEMSEVKPPTAGKGHCFSAPSYGELLYGGRKVVGSAQARRGDVFLQQGVVLLSVSPEWKASFPDSPGNRMSGLNEGEKKRKITRVALEKTIINAFEDSGAHFARVLKLADE